MYSIAHKNSSVRVPCIAGLLGLLAFYTFTMASRNVLVILLSTTGYILFQIPKKKSSELHVVNQGWILVIFLLCVRSQARLTAG